MGTRQTGEGILDGCLNRRVRYLGASVGRRWHRRKHLKNVAGFHGDAEATHKRVARCGDEFRGLRKQHKGGYGVCCRPNLVKKEEICSVARRLVARHEEICWMAWKFIAVVEGCRRTWRPLIC